MIMDERNEFAGAASVAAAVGTALIGDVINLGAAHRDDPVQLRAAGDGDTIQ